MHPAVRDVLAAACSAAGAALWTNVISRLVRRRRMSSAVARKVIHITTAPLFYTTVPLYSAQPAARFVAAAVPALFSVRLLRAAHGVGDDSFASAVGRSRRAPRSDNPVEQGVDNIRNATADVHQRASNLASKAKSAVKYGNADSELDPIMENTLVSNPRDAAGGPFWYGVAVSAVTAIGWRSKRATYVALGMLCFGDGAAEIGAREPIVEWPLPRGWKRKTLAGSLAFIAGGSLGSLALSEVAAWAGVLTQRKLTAPTALRLAGACAAVELLPFEDNVLVPAAAYLLADRSEP